MSGSGNWPGDDSERTQLADLPPPQRQILAALAVVGRASLSRDELAALVEVEDVQPLIVDLERRGLITTDEKKRYSAIGRVGERIRNTDAALATGDRLLGYMTTLARSGRLTPEQLVDDAEAILGLSEWASENRRWAQLLELVQTLQACFAIAHRVQEWLTLLGSARSAARALNDTQAEVWVLQQLATASAAAGDPAAAQRYLREADELQGAREAMMRQSSRTSEELSATREPVTGGGGIPQWLWFVAAVGAAVVGVGAGYAIGNDDGSVGVTTSQVPVTLTLPGQTITTSQTVTLPATTVLSTTTELTTTTVATTVTVVG